MRTSDWDKLFFYAVCRIFFASFFVCVCVLNEFYFQEFLRGSSQNVCAARVLDAIDTLLDTLSAFRSRVYPAITKGALSPNSARDGDGSPSAAVQLRRELPDVNSARSSSLTSDECERRTHSTSSDEHEKPDELSARGIQLLEDATELVASEFLVAWRCWKGEIDPSKDLGLPNTATAAVSESLVTLQDLGGDTVAHRAYAPTAGAHRQGEAAVDSDGASSCGAGRAWASPSPVPDDDDSETEEVDPHLRDPPQPQAPTKTAAQWPTASSKKNMPLADMAGFFRAVKAQLALIHDGLLRGETATVRVAALAVRELAEAAGSRSIAGRALAIECKAGGGAGLRVADVDALEQQIEAADAIWRSCRITV